jgi:flagellar biosynthetic protein FliO
MSFLSYVQAIVIFVAVLVLAVMTTRVTAFRFKSQAKNMRVLESLSLSPGKQLVMVKVPGKLMVLGVSDKSIRRLASIDEDLVSLDEPVSATPNLMDENSFARMLRKVTGKDR